MQKKNNNEKHLTLNFTGKYSITTSIQLMNL